MKKAIFILLFSTFILPLYSQILIYQDIFKGGITGDGFNPAWFNDSGEFNINIEPNSTIRKAYLFISVYENPENRSLNFNGYTIPLNASEAFSNDFIININFIFLTIKTLAIDVTSLINPNINVYPIEPPQNQPSPNLGGAYTEFYLYVAYENPNLEFVNTSIILNNQNADDVVSYPISNMNPMNLNQNIALAVHSDHFCDTFEDGSFIFINSTNIGLLGGKEDNTTVDCAGVTGSFHYQNGTTFGLGNDTADDLMAGTDALANIENYLTNTNSLIVQFVYQSSLIPQSNPVMQLFFSYVTPCETFTVNISKDTTICKNEQVQLEVSGGIKYEWLPQQGLTCYDCPNPIFSGDSSRVYTVQIWNNDSCSVVRPISMKVRKEPKLGTFNLLKPDCGSSNGILSLSTNPDSLVNYQLNFRPMQNNAVFENLNLGNHTIFFTDKYGCTNDSTLNIEDTIRTIANFSLSPNYGFVPFDVNIVNSSINATNYLWHVNENQSFNSLPNFTMDTSGYYSIELIAWQFDASCTDTFSLTVTAFDNVSLIIPNIFTPNNDALNDVFGITCNVGIKINYQIYNRWGNEMSAGSISYSSNIQQNFYPIWDGTSNASAQAPNDGVYFYKLEIDLMDELLLPNINVGQKTMEFPIKKEGFMQLVR